MAARNPFNTFRPLKKDDTRYFYSLPALEEQGIAKVQLLPVSIRILLESLLRNADGLRIKDEDILRVAHWTPKPEEGEVPFVVSRVILQDFTGVPLLVDLAAMRDAVAKENLDPRIIEPKVPVDLVVDHSVQVDRAGTDDAFLFNLGIEFQRNRERYEFLKWGQEAFNTFKVVPPGIGIVHQVNLEHLASVVLSKKDGDKSVLYPDTLVGTDSHTTMINGLGVVGWGVGGIEAEAAMLGLPVSIQMPEVVGVFLSGSLNEGVTATDLTLRITEMLRKEKVVDKFVEFIGPGTSSLTVADRATIANMSPEYGATIGYFPVDDKTLEYLRTTGRSESHIQEIKEYLVAQQLFGIPQSKEIRYSKLLELDLSTILPCVSGPKRPQDRIDLNQLKPEFNRILEETPSNRGYGIPREKKALRIAIHTGGFFPVNFEHDSGGTFSGNGSTPLPWSEEEMIANRPWNMTLVSPGYTDTLGCEGVLTHGSIVIAAITSCTNTSNPAVMIAAGLLAKKAVEKGLKISPLIKTSLAPGSRVVTDYLERTGLQKYLDELGFHLVAYGCTTCIGNSGPLDERIEEAIKKHDLVAASVLSGNRNFEARIHSAVKANFLMSPPLVVAFALAGRIDIDLLNEPVGLNPKGDPIYLKDIWPTSHEIQQLMQTGITPEMFKKRYSHILEDNPIWGEIKAPSEAQYDWDSSSTYIQKPPYFDDFKRNFQTQKLEENLSLMRPLAFFGDSVTTDHISPAGAFSSSSAAGKYLLSLGVKESDFNSYGSRRGNHQVMMRGTFGNVRIINKLADGKEGGYTKLMPEGELLPIFDACQKYAERNQPLIIFAGKDYGMGSSRDWAAKGPALLGVKVVVARSFERIHRSNLIGMGILPLEFDNDESWESLGLTGDELFTLRGIEKGIKPKQSLVLEIVNGKSQSQTTLKVRIDTPIELEYFQSGGILPYVLRKTLK